MSPSSVCLSINMSICLNMSQDVSLFCLYVSICLPLLCVCPSICLSLPLLVPVCLSVILSACLSLSLYVSLSLSLSLGVCPPACLFVALAWVCLSVGLRQFASFSWDLSMCLSVSLLLCVPCFHLSFFSKLFLYRLTCTCLSFYLSVYQSVQLSAFLFPVDLRAFFILHACASVWLSVLPVENYMNDMRKCAM